ncbi:MAG: HAMP domain-containing histidine kinase [Ruminococcus sp.]|nr:HAMP domain-containing histidine kinase [Ruminococcus sp.]
MAVPEEFLSALRQALSDSDAESTISTTLDPSLYVGTQWEELSGLLSALLQKTAQTQENNCQFLSNVSHELRTPITVISGYVEGILDGAVSKSRQTEILSVVDQELKRMNQMITAMLNLSRLEAGTLQLHRSWLTWNDLAFRTLLLFQNRLEKRQIAIEGLDDLTVQIYADADLMGQVMFNLIENAVKFVNTNGTITFHFSETDTTWCMTLCNTGSDISVEEQEKLFERFYQSSDTAPQNQVGISLGLGLNLVYRLVQLHDGQVVARSPKAQETEFEIRLPKMC